jgi:DNA-binding NtrC family response regulator
MRAIVACADPEIRQRLLSVLSEFGLQPVLPETLDDAKGLITQEETVMAFVQPRFSDGNFQEILRAANGPRSRVPVIVCSEFYDKELYIEAMSLGAFDYLAFPYRREDVEWVVNNAVSRGSLYPRARAQGEA